MKNRKGFTLVEALAVIAILAVILVIATLTLKNISESSKNQTFKVLVNSMQNSVREAYSKAESGYTILLSPACASWDQYDNFEIRGCEFKDEVNKLV